LYFSVEIMQVKEELNLAQKATPSKAAPAKAAAENFSAVGPGERGYAHLPFHMDDYTVLCQQARQRKWADYPGLKYWKDDTFSKENTKKAGLSNRARTEQYPQLKIAESETGEEPDEQYRGEIRRDFVAIFDQLKLDRLAPAHWSAAPMQARAYLVTSAVKMHPRLALGTALHKVHYIATVVYSDHVKMFRREDPVLFPSRKRQRRSGSVKGEQDTAASTSPTASPPTLHGDLPQGDAHIR
jgi:hypothetical protein